jgi:hypothetical protein
MNNTPLTDEQRRGFAELVKEAQKKFEQDFDKHLLTIKSEMSPRIDLRSKAAQLMSDLRSFRTKLTDVADQLRRYGYRVVDDGGIISVDYDIERDARRLQEDKVKEAREDHERATAGFRKAIFDVYSADSLEEAREVARRLVA